MSKSFLINRHTPIVMSSKETVGVKRAVADLANDWYTVFGMEPHILEALPAFYKGDAIYIGSAANGQASSGAIVGRECYRIELGESALTLRGSDELGTIFSVYRFCEEVLGVDPWYFWNDFLPEKKDEIKLEEGFELIGKEPSFRYRGFFINNEDLLTGSYRDPYYENQTDPYYFDKICELILRLYGNTIAPGTRIYPDETARDFISDRGLYVNDHHVTPLGLNVYTWPKDLPFSYITNPEVFEDLWKKCIDAQKHRKMLWTVTFRGKGDGPFWHMDTNAPADNAGRGEVISRAIAKQVELIREVQPEADIIFNMYEEQAELYKEGHLRIPEGVIRVWSNDGAGYLTDAGRSEPGDGTYYHVSACRNRITEAVSPKTCYEEIGRLRKKGGDGCLIINVGNIRPFPVSLGSVMKFAYDAERYLVKEPHAQMEQTVLEYTQSHYDDPEIAKKVASLYVRLFDTSNFRKHEEGKAPFGYGEECLGMYKGMWGGDVNPVLSEFRQGLYLHQLCGMYIKVLKGEDAFSEIWAKTVDDFNSVLYEDTAYLPALFEESQALINEIPARSKDLYMENVVTPIRAIHFLNLGMEQAGLSVKAYMNGDKEEAIAKMKSAIAAMEEIFKGFHLVESVKWQVWYKHEYLACFVHAHNLMECVLSLLLGNGETIVRPFWNFGAHNKHVALYQFERGSKYFPYFHAHTADMLAKQNKE